MIRQVDPDGERGTADRQSAAGTGTGVRPGGVVAVFLSALLVVAVAPGLAGTAGADGTGGGVGGAVGSRVTALHTSGQESAGSLDPVARCEVSKTTVEPGESVTLDASASEDATLYRYDETGDGEFGPWLDFATTTVSYEQTGTYRPRVQVESDGVVDGADCGTVTVETPNDPPSAEFGFAPSDPVRGETVSFSSGSSDPDGEVVAHRWAVDGETVAGGRSFDYTFDRAGEYTVELTVIDDDEASDTATRTVTVVARNEAPTAEFAYAPTDPAPGETVSFESGSADPDGEVVAREWAVDGQTVGEGPTLEYAFPGPGDYTVALTVTDDDGASDTTERVVTVVGANRPPQVGIAYSPEDPSPGGTIGFDSDAADPDGDVVAWRWFVDGEAVGDGPGFEYAFPGPGNYTVTVEVTDDDGANATASVTVPVREAENRAPTVDLSYSPDDPTPDREVAFTADASDPDGDVTGYEWAVDGETLAGVEGAELTRSFPGPGEYTVSVTVTDEDGASVTEALTVTVEAEENRAPTVDLSYSPGDPRPERTVEFVADAGDPDGDVTDYEWTVDGEAIQGATGPEFSRAFPGPGEYTVAVTVTDDDGASTTASATVTVEAEENRAPSVELSYSPGDPTPDREVAFTADASDPDGDVTGYEWAVDGEVIPGATGPEFSRAFPGPGEYTVSVTVTDDGANATREVTVTIEAAGTPTRSPETPTGDVTVTAGWAHAPLLPAAGERVALFATGPSDPRVDYRWDLDGDGEAESEGPTVSHAFPGPGNYTVTLRAVGPDGELASRTGTVRVVEGRDGTGAAAADGPSIWMSPLAPRPGERVRLAAEPAADPGTVEAYRWDLDGDGEFEREGRVVTHAFPGPGEYTVRVEVVREDGRRNASSGTVAAAGEPSVPRRTGPSVWISPLNPDPGERVSLTARPAVPPGEVAAYRWDLDGDGEVDAEGRVVTHAFPGDGAVDVSLTVERTNGSTASADGTVPVGNATVEPPGTTTGDDGTTTAGTTGGAGTVGPTEGPDDADDGGSDTDQGERVGLGLPGFGVGAAVVAVVAAALLAAGRRSVGPASGGDPDE